MCYVVEFNPEEVRVQQGTFDVTSSDTDTVSLATTLSGTDRAAMTFGWKCDYSATSDFSPHAVRGVVNSTSDITFYRAYNPTSSCTGHWFLFEDLNNNFRVTHISSSTSATTDPQVIDATRGVDPFRTFLLASYACTSTTSSYPYRQTCRIRLFSNSTVFYNKSVSTNTVYWTAQVFEFLDTSKIYTPFSFDSLNLSTTLTHSKSSEIPFTIDTDTSTIAASMMQGLSYTDSTSVVAFEGIFVASKLDNSGNVYLERYNEGLTVRTYVPAVVDWAGISVDIGSNSNIIPEGSGIGQSFVKSVENFRFSIDETVGAHILTKGQDWENCVVFASFINNISTSTNLSDCMVQVYLSPPGLVSFRKWTAGNESIVDVSVVEFWPNQIKVQRGEINLQGTSDEDTIEELSDLNKSFMVSSTFVSAEIYYPTQAFVRARIKDTTTVEFYRYAYTAGTNVSYTVIEDLQENFISLHSTGSFGSYEILYDNSNTWPPHNCIIISSFTADSVSSYLNRFLAGMLYDNVHSPLHISKDSSTSSIYWSATLVKFLDGRFHTEQIPVSFNSTTNSGTGTYTSMFLDYPDSLSCFNISILSNTSSNSTSTSSIKNSFASIRITDYDTGEYEYNRQYNDTFAGDASFVLVNWVGVDYRNDNNIPLAIPTKSLVKSIQHDFFYDSESYYYVFLTEGQKVSQCVPFLCSGASSTDGLLTRIYKNVFRFDDEEMFLIKYPDPPSGDRHLGCYTVEFNDDIRIQNGSGYSIGTSLDFTIDEVNLNRAFLVFYNSSNAFNTYGSGMLVAGKFLNSTTLRFERATSYEAMYITWYVIECPDNDDYWYVHHYAAVPPTSVSTIPISIANSVIDIQRIMMFVSFNTDATSSYNSRILWLSRFTNNNNVLNLEKYSSTSSATRYNVEIVEMSTRLHDQGFKSISDLITLSTSLSGTTSLKLREGQRFDLNRSMVLSSNVDNSGLSQGSSVSNWDEAYFYYDFLDDNTIYAKKSRLATITSTSTFFAYQFPDFNKYYMEGYVTELTAPVARTVNAYRASTGELVDSTTSVSGTGYFLLETPYPDEHYVVCLDDVANISYNHLVYGKIIPTVISGSFAYNNNLVTLSGLEVGVPLCYQ
jgi:hypothetical protein